jgi:hypothetical protein
VFLAVATLLGTIAVGSIVGGATPARAAATPVTYQATGTQNFHLTQAYSLDEGGDGWAAAVGTNAVFNVTHHQPKLEVDCHYLSNGSSCWGGQKTVSAGPHQFATPVGAGIHLDTADGLLYVYAVETPQDTAGVECVNTTLPASTPGSQMSCGFTPLSAAGDAPLVPAGPVYPIHAGLSAPVQVGSNWYSFNEVAGAQTGTRNKLLCFSLATFSPCASQPFALSYGGEALNAFQVATPAGYAGSNVFVQVAGAQNILACFDTATNSACAGSWPKSVVVAGFGGGPYPLNNTAGTTTGVCLPVAGDPCWALNGTAVATPPGMAAAIQPNDLTNGPALVYDNRVYLPNLIHIQVDCYNYASQSGCANFPVRPAGLGLLYTVNPDPQLPNCIWVNSGSGPPQIQNLDAISGGVCQHGPIVIPSSTLINSSPVCEATTFLSLQLTNPSRSSYASAQVQFENSSGGSLGIPPRTLNASGYVSLAGLNLTAVTHYPQFVIVLTGQVGQVATMTYRLNWQAAYNPVCVSGGQKASTAPGYWMVASDGGIFTYGTARFYGSAGNLALNKPIVGMAANPTAGGYWLVASDGGIFSYGDAPFYGSTGNLVLNKPIVGMAATPDGGGYWMVASDGGIFAFGDATFFGSAGNLVLNKPIVGMATTPDGGGYWLVASDGGVFAYGDAPFYGSTGNITLNKPIVGMAADPNGGGYWMVASDGGLFSYGASQFYGSTGNLVLNKPVVGMSPTFDGAGYWLVASDGGIFSFGDAQFAGSAGNLVLNKPIVGMTS